MSIRDILIVGAGPSGLATAIAAKQQGLDYALVEKGVLVDAIFNFPTNMVFFTTPELLEIGGLPLVTPYDKPTRLEALRYYRRVVDTYGLQIAFHEEVVAIDPPSLAPPATAGKATDEDSVFAVTTRTRHDVGADLPPPPRSGRRATRRVSAGWRSASRAAPAGRRSAEREGWQVRPDANRRTEARRVRHARAVVLAIGYYDHPNYLGIPGEDLPHVSHYYTEAHPYYRQRVVIVGGKNSAAETALELFRAGAHVTLVHRHASLGDTIKYWVRPDIDNRIKEGSIVARFETHVVEIKRGSVVVESTAGPVAGGLPPSREASADLGQASGREGQAFGREEIAADAVFLLTGYKPDVDLMRRAGVHCSDETLEPDLNPETFETNVPNLFIAGGAIAGRNTGSIFIENGRFHGERVIKVLSERLRRD